MKKIIALMYDDTVVTKDFDPRMGARADIHRFDSYETAHKANMVIVIDGVTLETEIIKNRYGMTGKVQPKSEYKRGLEAALAMVRDRLVTSDRSEDDGLRVAIAGIEDLIGE